MQGLEASILWRSGKPEADYRSQAGNAEALSLTLHKREQAGLGIASGGGALERKAVVLLHLEQNRLLNLCRCRHLLAAALQKLAPNKPFAVG